MWAALIDVVARDHERIVAADPRLPQVVVIASCNGPRRAPTRELDAEGGVREAQALACAVAGPTTFNASTASSTASKFWFISWALMTSPPTNTCGTVSCWRPIIGAATWAMTTVPSATARTAKTFLRVTSICPYGSIPVGLIPDADV